MGTQLHLHTRYLLRYLMKVICPTLPTEVPFCTTQSLSLTHVRIIRIIITFGRALLDHDYERVLC